MNSRTSIARSHTLWPRRATAVLLLVLAGSSGVASRVDAGETPIVESTIVMQQTSQPSKPTAVLLSVLATGGIVGGSFNLLLHDEGWPGVLPIWWGVAAGLTLGPAVGYAYGGVADRGVKGIALRAGLLALSYAGATASQQTFNHAVGMLSLGVLAAGASAVYDIAVLPKHIEQRYGVQSSLDVGVRDGELAVGWTARF